MNRTTAVDSCVLIGYGSIGRYHARVVQNRYDRFVIVEFKESVRGQASQDYPNATVVSSLQDLDVLRWEWQSTLAIIASWGPSHAAFFADLAQRGVRHILCEKPLAHSVIAGSEMIDTANELGIALGSHHTRRYSGFVDGLNRLADELDIGPPGSFVMHGGAIGLVTVGIQHIDLACEIFDATPEIVVSTAVGDPINPRSTDLMYYGGTAAWVFDGGREATMCFSNRSSVAASISIYYRDAVIHMTRELDIEVHRRDPGDIERYPAVTRTGPTPELAFAGTVPGVRSPEESTRKLVDEIESGNVKVFPPSLALHSLSATIGALAASESRRAVSLPIVANSPEGRKEWPIS